MAAHPSASCSRSQASFLPHTTHRYASAARRWVGRLAAAAVLVSMSFGVGCTGGSKPADGDGAAGGIKIVATTGPVGDMVRAIAGDLAEVDVMMGPGVDPHLYKQLPSDVKKLDAADIVFFNGLHLEGQFAEVLEKRSEQYPVFAVTHDLEQAKDERLRYPSEFEGFADPHLWHDAALWSECAGSVAARLAEVDPDNADAYKAAGEAYRDELLQLDKECREQLASLPESSRVLVTAHDAFGYYSKAYGLESVGLKGISTEDEVALSRMDEVAQLIIDRGISAVFVESSETPRIVEAVIEPCVEAGHKVKIGGELFADALGPPGSGAETYIGMMRTNTATIVSGLKGE